MNILLLANHFNVGGITSYILNLSRGLKLSGDNVYVASSGGEMVPRLSEGAIEHIRVPLNTKCEISPKIWVSWRRLKAMIREKDISVIHANTRVTQVLAWLLSRSTGRPYLSTCHGFFRPRLLRRIFPFWGRKVIAISREVEGHLKNDFALKAADVHLVYHGIDTVRFGDLSGFATPESRESLGIGQGQTVSIIARLSDVKGHRYLLEAFADVIKEFPGAKLIIAGEGKTGPELRALAKELFIAPQVLFMPSATDTRRILGVSDVFVMPSINEGLGLGVMEAMASGVAVVASDVGGLRSLVKDRVTGLLVKPADPVSISQAIRELLRDGFLRKKLGSAAQEFIKDNFSLNKMVDQTREVYQECLDPAS